MSGVLDLLLTALLHFDPWFFIIEERVGIVWKLRCETG